MSTSCSSLIIKLFASETVNPSFTAAQSPTASPPAPLHSATSSLTTTSLRRLRTPWRPSTASGRQRHLPQPIISCRGRSLRTNAAHANDTDRFPLPPTQALQEAGHAIRGWILDAELPRALQEEIRAAYQELIDESGARRAVAPCFGSNFAAAIRAQRRRLPPAAGLQQTQHASLRAPPHPLAARPRRA